MAKEKDPLIDALVATVHAGVDANGISDLRSRAAQAPEDFADVAARLRASDDDEAPGPVLEFLQAALQARLQRADAGLKGTIDDVTTGSHWSTNMPAESPNTTILSRNDHSRRSACVRLA